MATLLRQTLTANGNTATLEWGGGVGYYASNGTWGSGTTALQVSPNGGTNFISAGTDGNLTADGIIRFELPEKTIIQVNLSGATSPSLAITIWQ